MKVELNKRSILQKRVLIALGIAFVFVLAFSVELIIERDFIAIIFLFLVFLFGFLLYLQLWPENWNSMSLVKGQMTYSELKHAIEHEDFDDPFTFINHPRLKHCVFLVSDNWVLLGRKYLYDDPFCIPKDRVVSIEVFTENLLSIDKLSEQERSVVRELKGNLFCSFDLVCDDDTWFPTGLIASKEMDNIVEELGRCFPRARIRKVSEYGKKHHSWIEEKHDIIPHASYFD